MVDTKVYDGQEVSFTMHKFMDWLPICYTWQKHYALQTTCRRSEEELDMLLWCSKTTALCANMDKLLKS